MRIHHKQKIQTEPLDSQYTFQCAEIGDFCGRPGNHKCGCISETHTAGKPFHEQRDRSASADIEWNADRGSHQYTEALVAAEQGYKCVRRYISLKYCGKQHTNQKIRAGCFYVAPDVFQQPQNYIGARKAIKKWTLRACFLFTS